MSQPTKTEQTKPMTRREAEATLRRLQAKVARRTKGLTYQEKDALADEAAQEIKDSLSAILSGGVTTRTAGSLRVAGVRRMIEEARAAFERAVAEENAS
jgi:cytosine/adenosine deaminase-related metal-dependent hydrolase